MPQILTQSQKLEQRQQLSAQQILVAKLTELSVEELRARIETECLENPWLERKETDDSGDYEAHSLTENSDSFDNDTDHGSEDSEQNRDEEISEPSDHEEGEAGINESSLSAEENDWGGDEFPIAYTNEDKQTREDGEILSFHELLLQQVGEYDLTEHQRTLVEYLIGSLDDDGLLRTPLYQIADELDIYRGIHTSERELEHLLTHILQEFEPWGVGARNLVECLLIQVQHNPTLSMRTQLIEVFERYATEFMQNHWAQIQRRMKLSDTDLAAMRRSIQHLNPRPGGSIGRSVEEAAHVVVPDFKVQTDDYGGIQFQLCEQGIPQLQMSEDPNSWMDMYGKQDDKQIRRDVLEALRYQRNLVEKGNLFIEALAQRRRSLIAVMEAIIYLQRPFFLEGDETLLRPMRMEDITQITGLDISTVSRVCRSKSVSTNFGTYRLRWFFSSSTTKEGETLTVRHILSALKRMVDEEDKQHPLSDETLTDKLQEEGYDVARRTVAKYREQLGIPNSRMRR